MAKTPQKWVHALFYPKRPETGHYRFCKICWPEGEPSIQDCQRVIDAEWPLSSVYGGCCLSNSSTSGMINHFRSKAPNHRQYLPESVAPERTQGEQVPVNHKLMREWSEHMVLGGLIPVQVVETAKGIESIQGLGGAKIL